MKIDALDIYWVKLPLAVNFRTSYGDQLYTETMLVRMESEGQYAWGESCPPYVPSYSAEHTTGTFHTLRALMAPRIIGQEIASAQDLLDRLAFIKGNQFARAALEITWWVLDAKRRGLPLHRALGGSRDRVAVGADLQKRIETPVCLDESALSLAHVQAAIRLGSCKVVNIKMARVGGLTASRDIQALCAEHGIPCWIGGMLESAIGGAICAELATLPNFTYPGDIFPSSYFYKNDIGKPEIVLSGRGEVATSRVPGIAQEPDADLLKQWTVEHASFRV